MQEIYLPDLPIYKGVFIRQGKEILFSGNRRHFYSYDLLSNKLEKQGAILGHHDEMDLSNLVASPGPKYFAFICKKSGYILVMGQDSKKLLFDLKMNGSCNSVAFSRDERYLFSVGDEAEIYQWDLKTRKCVKKTADEGGFHTVKLAISPNGLLLETASKMGTVNLFNVNPYTQLVEEKPFKTLGHLTTAISELEFNPTS